jgi:hypothetical protein
MADRTGVASMHLIEELDQHLSTFYERRIASTVRVLAVAMFFSYRRVGMR